MLQTCTNCPIADIGKNHEKTTLLTLLFDLIRDIKLTPIGQGSILQTMARITRIVGNLMYWREDRLFPVSPMPHHRLLRTIFDTYDFGIYNYPQRQRFIRLQPFVGENISVFETR
jgi:hypothetical protein